MPDQHRQVPERWTAIRVPRGSWASRASTGLCSASGRIGPTSISRCRPSTQRSRNVRSSEQRRRRPGATVVLADPARGDRRSGPARGPSPTARERRSSRAGPRSSGRPPTSGARPTRCRSAGTWGSPAGLRAWAITCRSRIRLQAGIAVHGIALKRAIEPPGDSRASRASPVLRTASSIRPSTSPGSRAPRRSTNRRSERPGRGHSAPAVESLARQHRQRQGRRQAPARRSPEEREARQHDQEPEPRHVRTQAQEQA